MKEDEPTGLGGTAQSEWTGITPEQAAQRPIERLAPESPLHRKTLEYILERLAMSERRMSQFYSRWRCNEAKLQAYINLPDWEQKVKEMNNKHAPPEVVSIVVPYNFATIATIVTYLIHTFCGRKPMFQVGSHKPDTIDGAQKMETLLQYNSDHTRLVRHLFQYLNDGEVYGLGVLRTQWKKDRAMRTVWKTQGPKLLGFQLNPFGARVPVREERVTYEGNDVRSIDPFMFFPDPRVPMVDVNRRGEFVFWRNYEGKHTLLRAQKMGQLSWVDRTPESLPRQEDSEESGESARNLLSGGSGTSGYYNDSLLKSKNYYQVDQGTIEIIPSELGLGPEDFPQKWLFTILNKKQIVQAQPLDLDHDMHPVAVIEPYTLGYGFGNPGITDYLGPLQDTVSWFINSHIHNVRSVLNNSLVVDPSMVEMQDVTKPGPGKVIRLKRAAFGQDVRAAVSQLQVVDVTQGHMRDLQVFMRMGDALSSITDNLRGLQDSGGRKTATESRQSAEAGASRLAAHARLISSQGIVDLTEQMVLNIQQNMSEEFYLAVVGQDGRMAPMRIAPEMVTGDFYYPINDGTLPLDRVAMLDVWKEIFLAVAQDQQLRQEFSVTDIFGYLAELGGAKNIDRFKLQVNPMPSEQIQNQAQAGNLVPIKGSGVINALGGGAPAQRMAGGA